MGIIKIILFHLLLSLRRPILFLSKILALMFLGCFAMAIYVTELQQTPMAAKIMLVSIGIVFTAINWFYDYLVLYLAPRKLGVMLSV